MVATLIVEPTGENVGRTSVPACQTQDKKVLIFTKKLLRNVLQVSS
jgi:hypothetical protein